jgi:hypothetical protein
MTGNRRLEILERYLNPENFGPKNNFNMSYWYSKLSECGFTACVLEHAALIPELQDEGLINASYTAAEKFFGLTTAEARWLFDPKEYQAFDVLPWVVANRIKKLRNRWGITRSVLCLVD